MFVFGVKSFVKYSEIIGVVLVMVVMVFRISPYLDAKMTREVRSFLFGDQVHGFMHSSVEFLFPDTNHSFQDLYKNGHEVHECSPHISSKSIIFFFERGKLHPSILFLTVTRKDWHCIYVLCIYLLWSKLRICQTNWWRMIAFSSALPLPLRVVIL